MEIECETIDISESNLQCEFCGARLNNMEPEQCRFCGGFYCINCMATEDMCNECYEQRKVSPSLVPCEITKPIQPFNAETNMSHHRSRRRLL